MPHDPVLDGCAGCDIWPCDLPDYPTAEAPLEPPRPVQRPTSFATHESAQRERHTVTSPFGNYVEPAVGDGDQYRPKEHAGANVIAKIRELKHGIVTEHSPEGGDGLVVDVLDLADGQLYREVLWMGGAWVDGLKEHVGKEPVVLTITAAKSKQGRTYFKPVAGPVELAQAYWAAQGDPFVPAFATPTPEAAPAAPAAAAAPWATKAA